MTQLLTNDLLGKVKKSIKEIEAEIEAEIKTLFRGKKYEKQKVMEDEVNRIKSSLPKSLQFTMDLASEKGASTWLSALPLEENVFFLQKGEF